MVTLIWSSPKTGPEKGLNGRSDAVVEAQRAAVHIAQAQMPTAELAASLSCSALTVRRLAVPAPAGADRRSEGGDEQRGAHNPG